MWAGGSLTYGLNGRRPHDLPVRAVTGTGPANTRHSSDDFSAVGKYVGGQVAAVVAASGTSGDPQGYGQAVARDLLLDVLPHVVGTLAVYGFVGFNGRTLADNAAEAMLSLVTGTAVPSELSRR